MRESKTMKKITRSRIRIRKVRACNLISLSPSVADLSWGSFSIAAAAMVDFSETRFRSREANRREVGDERVLWNQRGGVFIVREELVVTNESSVVFFFF